MSVNSSTPQFNRCRPKCKSALQKSERRSVCFGPRPVPGRSTLDSRAGSRGSPHAAAFPMRCAPGRRAARNLRTATGPRSQHVGFTRRLQRFAARCCFPHALRAGTARGPFSALRSDSSVPARSTAGSASRLPSPQDFQLCGDEGLTHGLGVGSGPELSEDVGLHGDEAQPGQGMQMQPVVLAAEQEK